ncbi:MAG: hypothetical protein MGAcid_05220 [uncultured Acidilobus sp. MG]|nr:MAG: hypothetical protein MGAcid_05220 [uncultured Acidilobus sp. MG]
MLSHTVELMKSSQGERPDGLPGRGYLLTCTPAPR